MDRVLAMQAFIRVVDSGSFTAAAEALGMPKATLTRGAETRRAELTRPGATPTELLLVSRVVACDLQVNYLAAAEAGSLEAGDSYRQVDFQAKRVERAQRMFLSAMGALVTFQRLVPIPQPVAASAAQVLPTQMQNEKTAESRLAGNATDSVPLVGEDVEPDNAEPELRERLRVGMTN